MLFLFALLDFLVFCILLHFVFIEKERRELIELYCTLIINGKKNLSQVPERLREQVRQMLIDLDLEFLTEE